MVTTRGVLAQSCKCPAFLVISCLLQSSLGFDVIDTRFNPSFGTKSVGTVIEACPERSRVSCAERCAARTLCAGFNWRKRSDGHRMCELIQGVTKGDDVEIETESIFYRTVNMMKYPRSCAEYYTRYGYKESGVFKVDILFNGKIKQIEVYCDMVNYGRGWLVAISRYNGSLNFDRNWTDYKNGFGDLGSEQYIGNDVLHALTVSRRHEVLIKMTSFSGETRHAQYESFLVDGEQDRYRLHVNGYSGDAGDAFSHHDNMAFSTYDKDNDLASYNCAAAYHGGFWYKACSMVRLTGRWGETPADEIVNGTNGLITYHQGIIWSTWLTFLKHPKTAVMMIRPAA